MNQGETGMSGTPPTVFQTSTLSGEMESSILEKPDLLNKHDTIVAVSRDILKLFILLKSSVFLLFLDGKIMADCLRGVLKTNSRHYPNLSLSSFAEIKKYSQH